MKKIEAKMVCDSIANGIRLCTIQTRAPKFLDAEFEKHRMLSSNSSSDRAIPTRKLVDDFYLPQEVYLDQPGMQGTELMSDDEVASFHDELIDLHGYTKEILSKWNKVHKQHINRYLLGFTWQSKVVTATEWDNFFVLRLPYNELNEQQKVIADEWKSKFGGDVNGVSAQPEMRILARCMKEAMDNSIPQKLKYGEWHLPYINKEDFEEYTRELDQYGNQVVGFRVDDAIKCSVARCARVSFNNHDGTSPDIDKDIFRHDDLRANMHMTPFENVATPMNRTKDLNSNSLHGGNGITHMDKEHYLWSANFRGWIQYRKLL